MNKYETSRGWRNRNPLNIRQGSKWAGLRAEQTDKVFCQFITFSHGYRAAAKCLRSYHNYFSQVRIDWNVRNIIHRWAPANENDTDAYIDRVLQLMGREGRNDARLAPPHTNSGRLQLAVMVAAMTCVECGCPPSAVPVASINTGFILAEYGDPCLEGRWWCG